MEEYDIFWSEIGSGFVEPGSTPQPRIPMSTHRRTGNFLPGGAVNHLPKKIFQVAQIFTKESKRNEGHITTT